MPETFDFVILGGGIVGLASALKLSAATPAARICVLEKEPEVGRHQTGHNSGVLHSGLYYKPGSLKARLCVDGLLQMQRFCEEHSIAHEVCGKVVVATEAAELPALDELLRRGAANGVPGLELIGPERLREIEPHATGVRALWVPGTGIADFGAVARTMARLLRERGVPVRTGWRCLRLADEAGALKRIETTSGELLARGLINCGGLHSDRIARLDGLRPAVRIVPFRGEYHELAPGRRGLVRNLIYPVPDARLPFLGVHFTRRVDGSVEAGPNAVLALAREGYLKLSFSARDTAETLAFPGFWRLALRFWSYGLGEMRRSLSKAAATRALQKLMPELQEADLHPGGAGVRAQALTPDGRLVDDFAIERGPRSLHVLNAPSPAATASLAIGGHIAGLALEMLGKETPPHAGAR